MSEIEKGVIRLQLKSTPFHGDPKGAPEFYEALGRAVVLWGRFEMHFSTTILSILALPEAEPIRVPLPLSWKKRASFWRRAFNELPSLKPFLPMALPLLKRIMESVEDRHFLAHTTWDNFVSADPLTMKASTLTAKKGTKDKIEFGNYHVTIEMLRGIAAEADALNTLLTPLSISLSSLRPPPPGTPIL